MSDAMQPNAGNASSTAYRQVQPARVRRPGTAAEHVKLIAIQQAIEMEVIPRLVLEHGARATPAGAARRGMARPEAVAMGGHPPADVAWADRDAAISLADVLLGPDPLPAVAQYAADVARPGAEAAGLALLTAAARHLGTLWEEDLASFTAVTLATAYLQQMLRALSEAAAAPRPGTPHATAMLIQVPGEQHTLGLSMLSHVFRRDGWNVSTPRVGSVAGLGPLLDSAEVDMIGFSMAADMHLNRLARCIKATRRASRNPALIVMVGGAAFLERPELGEWVGACATAQSAEAATAAANALLERRRAEPAKLASQPGRSRPVL